MSAKTKIVVLHMKELIYTAIFAALGILFVVLLVMMFLPDREASSAPENESVATGSDAVYIPGIYTTELVLGSQTIDVEVIVDKASISSIRMVNLNEQVYERQTLEGITYSSDSKYTSLVLLEAIQNSLNKAAAPAAE